MKDYIAIVSVSGENVTKYKDFDNENDAKAHVTKYGGFSQKSVGDMIDYYKVADGKATYNDDKIASDKLTNAWNILRQTRDAKLAESDYMGNSDVTMSSAWKTYRKALRDLPGTLNDTTVLETITWPTEPS
tara:strand:+ start:287 stop:679 length:393 start_codon:yes stop_codon:yes gene_type:complete